MVTQTIKEAAVVDLWRDLACRGTKLETVDAQSVRVLYPGRTSDEPGSDIKDAVFKINGNVTKGNIEIHVRSSDWRKHSHHRDKAYNGIVLHVVMFHDAEDLTGLENGKSVPIISLAGQEMLTNHEKSTTVQSQCIAQVRDICDEHVGKALDHAGKARFIEKQSAFLGELENTEAGQCLYRGIMGALGYSKNTVPCQTLAGLVTLREMEKTALEIPESSALLNIERVLLGTAGFSVENEQHVLLPKAVGILNTLPWRLFRVRPGNHPARRLAGMARLILRYKPRGLLYGLTKLLDDYTGENGWGGIIGGLVVAADGYWLDHYCPGIQCILNDRYLIGQSRAKEIVINVLFPFAAAYGQYKGQREKSENSLAVYSTWPAGEENNIDRHMASQLGIKRSQVKTAMRQQGLLHLYKRFCTQGKCLECPVGVESL
jgi:hypothetical protein